MTILLISIGLLGFLAYLFNEFEDESVRNRWKKHQDFLNIKLSYKNKWALDKNGKLSSPKYKWYYFGVIPAYKERFPYSSTLLVFLTDGEHLFQFLKFRMLDIAFLIIDWRFLVAFEAGKFLSSFVKEKFLKYIQ